MENEQKLGIRVFYYYLSKRVGMGILLFLVASIFALFKNALALKIISIFGISIISSIFNYITLTLYIVSLILIVRGIFVSWLDYINCTFTLDETSFNIKRGIMNKKELSIPYRQIQDISIEQTFYNKLLGVSKLNILTAGNDNYDRNGESEGIFEVIDSNIAENIRKSIFQKTNVQTVKEVKS